MHAKVGCGLAEGRSDHVPDSMSRRSLATMANPTASAVRAANMTRHRDRFTRPNSSAPQEVRL